MTPTPDGYYPVYPPQIDFGWFGRGWDAFRARAGLWIGVAFLCGLIYAAWAIPVAFVTGYARLLQSSFVPFLHPGTPPSMPSPLVSYGAGFLFGLVVNVILSPLLGGCYNIALRQLRGEPCGVGDLAGGFRKIVPLVVAGVIVQICALIGSYLCILPGLIAQGLFMFVPLLIVDRDLGPIQALSESVALVKSQWAMAAAFYFVAALLSGAGALLCGLGALVTFPIFILTIAVGYLALTPPPLPPQVNYGQPSPGVWPPPPQNP